MSMPSTPDVSRAVRTTAIEWTDATWNPVTGCTKVSEGCLNCYIERTPPFRMAHRKFDKPGIGGATGVKLYSDRLAMPLRWRKPRRVFVNSLSDLFHEHIPDAFIAETFAVMAMAGQHTFQILTKRPGRMRSLLAGARSNGFMDRMATAVLARGGRGGVEWPLRNVWLGVSVESQKWADVRIPLLLNTPAAVRWLSCEPLLGPVQLPFVDETDHCTCYGGSTIYGHEPRCGMEPGPAWGNLHWVVVGGESGPGARPMEPEWAWSLRDQCVLAGVPFFFKQWGGRTPKANGRELDGRMWDEYPVGM